MIAFPSPSDFVLPVDTLLHEDISLFDPSLLSLIALYKHPLDEGDPQILHCSLQSPCNHKFGQ
jgi:hypothetical protein